MSKISIIGLGSLLNKESALRTCPSASDFRFGYVDGYVRMFNRTDSNEIIRKKGKIETGDRFACLSAMPMEGHAPMKVSIFDIDEKDFAAFSLREFDYFFKELEFTDTNGAVGKGLACTGDFDNEQDYLSQILSCEIRRSQYNLFRSFYDGNIWRGDLLPSPYYIDLCLKILKDLGNSFTKNFFDTTYIGDGRETLGVFLKN